MTSSDSLVLDNEMQIASFAAYVIAVRGPGEIAVALHYSELLRILEGIPLFLESTDCDLISP